MNAVTVLVAVALAAPLLSGVAWAVAGAERPPAARPAVQNALGLCESCRQRPAVVVEVAGGEPFRVCEGCSTGGPR